MCEWRWFHLLNESLSCSYTRLRLSNQCQISPAKYLSNIQWQVENWFLNWEKVTSEILSDERENLSLAIPGSSPVNRMTSPFIQIRTNSVESLASQGRVVFSPVSTTTLWGPAGLVTNSIQFCWLFKSFAKVRFQQTQNQGLRPLLLTVLGPPRLARHT